ncbi:MAG: hypothetical protein KAS32_15170 [Candidatus Peribacteraceae bacterium]|nr:hypothetical protein [Candidatus Peribacteraceae bacterium]
MKNNANINYKNTNPMSERDILKKLWLSIASGLILIVAAAIIAPLLNARSNQERSIRNEKKIESLEQTTSKKGEYDDIHNNLFEEIKSNKKDTDELETKVDANQNTIIEHLFDIKDEIRELHTKQH